MKKSRKNRPFEVVTESIFIIDDVVATTNNNIKQRLTN